MHYNSFCVGQITPGAGCRVGIDGMTARPICGMLSSEICATPLACTYSSRRGLVNHQRDRPGPVRLCVRSSFSCNLARPGRDLFSDSLTLNNIFYIG